MKEVKETKISLDPSSFLTGNEVKAREMKQEERPQEEANIPNVHNEFGALPSETPPDFQLRNKINKEVETTINKETIRDQMLEEARSSVSSKYANVPSSGLDVIKHIIARGEYKEEVEVLGVRWTMRALDQMDDLIAIDEMSADYGSSLANMTAYAFSQVVLSVEAIQGQSIYEIFNEIDRSKYDTQLKYIMVVKRALRAYMLQFPPSAVAELHSAYKKIDEKRNKGLEELKKS